MKEMYKKLCGKRVRILGRHDKALEEFLNKQHVFIIGSKGIPAQYGGFETFVEKLVEYQTEIGIQYHVARMAGDEQRFRYKGAICFDVKVPDIGPARAVYYDLAALKKVLITADVWI